MTELLELLDKYFKATIKEKKASASNDKQTLYRCKNTKLIKETKYISKYIEDIK